MIKPTGYDNINAYGEFDPLEIGGHICVIQKVEEMVSRGGKDMVVIYLDTAKEDAQPGYYMDKWKRDSRPTEQKRWGCTVYQLVYDNEGNCNRGFKTFVTAVEESNPGFVVRWDETFSQCFVGKKVGGIFRREQYETRNGELKWSTKCFAFRSVQTIRDGVEKPEDKYLDDNAKGVVGGNSAGYTSSFAELSGDDGELPF